MVIYGHIWIYGTVRSWVTAERNTDFFFFGGGAKLLFPAWFNFFTVELAFFCFGRPRKSFSEFLKWKVLSLFVCLFVFWVLFCSCFLPLTFLIFLFHCSNFPIFLHFPPMPPLAWVRGHKGVIDLLVNNLDKMSLYPHILMYFHGTWIELSLGRFKNVISTGEGTKVNWRSLTFALSLLKIVTVSTCFVVSFYPHASMYYYWSQRQWFLCKVTLLTLRNVRINVIFWKKKCFLILWCFFMGLAHDYFWGE